MIKGDYNYKELESHIRSIHSASNSKQRKTILITGYYYYQVVTRVNNLTTHLWINHVNEIIKTLPKDNFDMQRFCWLTEQKNYKRDFLNELTSPKKDKEK